MSSVATTTSTYSSSSVTASPSATSSISTQPEASTFYKNLFYILIGLLCAFGLVSLFSLLRARRRRNIVIAEANRLGVIVPGIPGYVPLRDRAALKALPGLRSGLPEWWEVAKSSWTLRAGSNAAVHANGGAGIGTDGLEEGGKAELGLGGVKSEDLDEKNVFSGSVKDGVASRGNLSINTDSVAWEKKNGPFNDLLEQTNDSFYPLGIIAPPEQPIIEPPIPTSTIPFFPNHLAYRESSLLPRKPRFSPDDPEALEKIVGESVGVVVLIRMPNLWSSSTVQAGAGPGVTAVVEEVGAQAGAVAGGEANGIGKGQDSATVTGGACGVKAHQPVAECQEGEEVMEEWGGVELGIVRLSIEKKP